MAKKESYSYLVIAALSLCIACNWQAKNQGIDERKTTPTSKPTPKPTPPQAVVDAVKALRRMSGATEIGMNIAEYNRRLLDLNAETDEALAQLPKGALKTEIEAAIRAYIDALNAWRAFNSHAWCECINVEREPARSLQRKYSIRKRAGEGGNWFIDSDVTLHTIWSEASQHVSRASSFIEEAMN